MWLKKLSLLKFNKKVAATQLVEILAILKELELLAKDKHWA